MRRENSNEKVNYNKVQAAPKKEEAVKPVEENFETEEKVEEVKEEKVEEKSEPKETPKVEEKKEEKSSDKFATVIGCEELNIRSSADSNASNIVTVAKKGTKFKTTGKEENGFLEIEWNGAKAFGMAQYLSVE